MPDRELPNRSGKIDSRLPETPGGDVQLQRLHARWGQKAGLSNKHWNELDDAERNTLYEIDMRGGKTFYEGFNAHKDALSEPAPSAKDAGWQTRAGKSLRQMALDKAINKK